MAPPLLRSKLFVPGHREALFAKALASGADALSFDLEDAVPAAAKDSARLAVAAALRRAPPAGPLLIVRINALGTPQFAQDLQAVVPTGVPWINLPKVDTADEVRRAGQALDEWQAGPLRLLVNIETPLALQNAAAIAAAHPRVGGLQLGLADLFERLGVDRRDSANVHAAMFTMRMAAGAAGVFAVDAAWPDIPDLAGFSAEAAMARRLGYVGKSCIHPSQVAAAHAVFTPDAAEVAAARRIVQAAARQGDGVFSVDGRMVDAPFVQRARDVLAAAGADDAAAP